MALHHTSRRIPSTTRLLGIACVLTWAGTAMAEVVPVGTPAELVAAVDGAQAGDVIELAPGTYPVGQNLVCDAAGTEQQPIVVRTSSPGAAVIEFDAVEGFKVQAPWWVFENLEIRGVCVDDSQCEHGLHIVGAADHTVVRRCSLREYNAAIKGNGLQVGSDYVFPDDVLVEDSVFANSAVRQTSNPVTPIDVVGGRRWIVRGNRISDFGKGEGNGISYAAFLKGNSRDGLFERNLVICEENHTGGIRLGLSLGGGGSGPPGICEDGTCTPEHQNGVLRNNLILNCPDDVGIYLNEAAGTSILHNTIYASTGIDVRFGASTADLQGNVLSGAIRDRDGGSHTAQNNLTGVTEGEWTTWFANPSTSDFTLLDGSAILDQGAAVVGDDYCGAVRDATPDLGALEYPRGEGPSPCDTSGSIGLVFADGFESGDVQAW